MGWVRVLWGTTPHVDDQDVGSETPINTMQIYTHETNNEKLRSTYKNLRNG